MRSTTTSTRCSMRHRAGQKKREAVALAYLGNVVDLWERLAASDVAVDLGSDQTSLHNPVRGRLLPGRA